ncbi:hypothetical protein [Enterococcus sp. DIV0756]|uniref:hypothetical protein n=1 Tax=Enterococcus sp. DIV0756 TaxID=2774636 RepID=UPI003F224D30
MIDKPDFRRQKIRGWKRRVKEIDHWKTSNMSLDLGLLEEYSRDYVKLGSLSFYSLFRKYDLPSWYKRLIVQALVDVFDSWKQTLDELDEPYYLKIWIFDKDILHSQVVASYREKLNFYENTFAEIERVESLPEELAHKKANELLWRKGFDLVSLSENELQEDFNDGFYTLEEVQSIRDSANCISEISDDKFYVIKNGIVWLGER